MKHFFKKVLDFLEMNALYKHDVLKYIYQCNIVLFLDSRYSILPLYLTMASFCLLSCMRGNSKHYRVGHLNLK